MKTPKLELEIRQILCNECDGRIRGVCVDCLAYKRAKSIYKMIARNMSKYSPLGTDWVSRHVEEAFDFLKYGGE